MLLDFGFPLLWTSILSGRGHERCPAIFPLLKRFNGICIRRAMCSLLYFVINRCVAILKQSMAVGSPVGEVALNQPMLLQIRLICSKWFACCHHSYYLLDHICQQNIPNTNTTIKMITKFFNPLDNWQSFADLWRVRYICCSSPCGGFPLLSKIAHDWCPLDITYHQRPVA